MWKHPKELNKIEDFSKPIIYWTWNNKCNIFKDLIVFYGGKPENVGTLEQHIDNWMWKVKKYNIKWWQFVDELAPSGLLGFKGLEPYGCEEHEITRELWDAIGNNDLELQYKLILEITGDEKE